MILNALNCDWTEFNPKKTFLKICLGFWKWDEKNSRITLRISWVTVANIPAHLLTIFTQLEGSLFHPVTTERPCPEQNLSNQGWVGNGWYVRGPSDWLVSNPIRRPTKGQLGRIFFYIFQMSLNQQRVPKSWKQSTMSPVAKKTKQNNNNIARY